MNYFNTLLLSLLLAAPAMSQSLVKGVVRDPGGNGLPGANVLLVNTYDGASTDLEGRFEFRTSEMGGQLLRISAIGFDSKDVPVQLDVTTIVPDIRLVESATELNSVVITAGTFTAREEGRRTNFRPQDIVTTAGATADIAGALNSLPGTQKVGETGRLFVRGGDDNETRTFIDGMVVLDAYQPAAHNTPTRGRFLPFMFKGTTFSTGGYSAEYGQALSSALTLDSKDEEEASRTDIGLLSVGGDLAHTRAWSSGSLGAKVQYTNLKPYMGWVPQSLDWIRPPESFSVSAAARQRVAKEGMLKFYTNATGSSYSLYQHEILGPTQRYAVDLTNRYCYENLSYRGTLGAGWFVRTGLSYTRSDYEYALDSSSLKERAEGVHVKFVTEKTIGKTEIKAGTETILRDYRAVWENEQQGTLTQDVREPLTAAFVEADVPYGRAFLFRAGLRTEYNGLTANASVDPRISATHKLGEGQVSLAYGRFRQSPNIQWQRSDPSLKSEKAEHWILSYQRINEGKTFRIEGYHKRYLDLVKFPFTTGRQVPSSIPITGDFTNDGSGWARGMDVFWRDNQSIRNVDYWRSYYFLDTRRDYLGFPGSATPAFASAHNFSAVYKHFLVPIRTQVSLTYSIASGRPYHNPNKPGYLQERTPAYQDLSASVSYLPTQSIIIHLSCTNLPGFDNVFGYEYAAVTNPDGVYASRPIKQPAPRFIFLGVLITLSKNKGINQLPNL